MNQALEKQIKSGELSRQLFSSRAPMGRELKFSFEGRFEIGATQANPRIIADAQAFTCAGPSAHQIALRSLRDGALKRLIALDCPFDALVDYEPWPTNPSQVVAIDATTLRWYGLTRCEVLLDAQAGQRPLAARLDASAALLWAIYEDQRQGVMLGLWRCEDQALLWRAGLELEVQGAGQLTFLLSSDAPEQLEVLVHQDRALVACLGFERGADGAPTMSYSAAAPNALRGEGITQRWRSALGYPLVLDTQGRLHMMSKQLTHAYVEAFDPLRQPVYDGPERLSDGLISGPFPVWTVWGWRQLQAQGAVGRYWVGAVCETRHNTADAFVVLDADSLEIVGAQLAPMLAQHFVPLGQERFLMAREQQLTLWRVDVASSLC